LVLVTRKRIETGAGEWSTGFCVQKVDRKEERVTRGQKKKKKRRRVSERKKKEGKRR